MEISPPGGPPRYLSQKVPFGPHPKPGASALSPEERASESEKEAQRRISAAEQSVEEADRDTNYQLERLKDEYQRQQLAETVREEGAYETQKNKGYEQIRELQRQQQAELNRVRREGDAEQARLKQYYRDSNYGAERRGKEQLAEIESQSARRLDYEQRMGALELDQAQQVHHQRVEMLRESEEEKAARLAEAGKKEYERMRENYVSGNERAEQQFQEKYAATVQRQSNTLDGIESQANAKIREIRTDTSQKLAAYSSRQRDPFYRMVDLKARLYDEGDHFVLTARIPEHEQHHVNVSIKGNHVMLSGQRRNEEKLELSPGHTMGTAAFQSFTETFPLDWPVDSHRLTKEFNGDELVVTIPKKNEYAFKPMHAQSAPERARVEKPKFPDNLPHVASDPLPDPDAPASGPVPKRGMGQRTLS